MSHDTDFGSYVADKEASASPERRAQMDAARNRTQRLHDEHFAHAERELGTDPNRADGRGLTQ